MYTQTQIEKELQRWENVSRRQPEVAKRVKWIDFVNRRLDSFERSVDGQIEHYEKGYKANPNNRAVKWNLPIVWAFKARIEKLREIFSWEVTNEGH